MFTKIDQLIWKDSKYKLLSDDGKFLFLYVLSCPHRNMLGFYFLPIPYGAFDLGWNSERFTKGLEELLDNEFINYNFNTNIIFIKNFLKYNPLENPNQVKGAIKALNVLPTNSIDKELVEYLKTINKPFVKPLIELLKERLSKQVYVDVDVEEDEDVYETKTRSSLPNNDYDNNFKEIAQLYQQVIGQANSLTSDWIDGHLEEHGFEWLKNALLVAEEQGKRTKSYVNGTLNNWKTEGGMNIGGKDKEKQNKEHDPYAGLEVF